MTFVSNEKMLDYTLKDVVVLFLKLSKRYFLEDIQFNNITQGGQNKKKKRKALN